MSTVPEFSLRYIYLCELSESTHSADDVGASRRVEIVHRTVKRLTPGRDRVVKSPGKAQCTDSGRLETEVLPPLGRPFVCLNSFGEGYTLMKTSARAAIALFVVMSSFMTTSSTFAESSAAPSGNAAPAGTTFRTKCSGCHGPSGAGDTDIGRTLKVPDLRAPEIQKQSRAQLNDAITNGKNNRMPAFKDSLSPDQVRSLVQYIRQLSKTH